jgi:hypothetical protein
MYKALRSVLVLIMILLGVNSCSNSGNSNTNNTTNNVSAYFASSSAYYSRLPLVPNLGVNYTLWAKPALSNCMQLEKRISDMHFC